MDELLTHIYRKDYDALRAALTEENINSADEDGFTPLIHAVLDSDAAPEMVTFLIAAGAKADTQDSGQAWTPLHFAARDQNATLVRILLDSGVRVDPLDSFGNTPLWRAVMNGGSPTVVEMLLRAGADPRRHNSNGVSPIDVAERIGRSDLVELLRKV